MDITSLTLLGAGAVGSYMIWGLSHKPGIWFSVAAGGARKLRLEKDGIRINDKAYHPLIQTPEEIRKHGTDLIVVALKYGALPSALADIRTMTGEHTVVMSLMNGVDSEEKIAQVIGKEHLLYSLIKIASHKEADGYHFDPQTTIGIIFGEKEPPYESARVKAVKELFADTGVNIRSTEYIQEEMWQKFRLNICNNLPQAILGAGVGCYRDSEHMNAIRDGLRQEVNAVALAQGIHMDALPKPTLEGCMVSPSTRYSTLQDLDAGRHTEIDMFSGAMIQMGRQYGIPVPYNEYTYHMIKALEEKNDGLFDYKDDARPTAAR